MGVAGVYDRCASLKCDSVEHKMLRARDKKRRFSPCALSVSLLCNIVDSNDTAVALDMRARLDFASPFFLGAGYLLCMNSRTHLDAAARTQR